MIGRERLTSEKQNNKASAEASMLPKEAMLLRDISNLPSHPGTRFVLLDSSAELAKGQEVPPIAITLTFIKQTNKKHKTYVPFTFEQGHFDVLLAARLWTKTDIFM